MLNKLNKYYIDITNNELCVSHIFIMKSKLTIEQLYRVIEKMYCKTNDDIKIVIQYYNIKHKMNIIDAMQLKNICVAKNVEFYLCNE